MAGSLVLLVKRFGTLPKADFFEDFLDPRLRVLIGRHDDMPHLIERITKIVKRVVVDPEVTVLFRVTASERKRLEEVIEVFRLLVEKRPGSMPEFVKDDGRTCTALVENIHIHSVSFVLITLRRLRHRS